MKAMFFIDLILKLEDNKNMNENELYKIILKKIKNDHNKIRSDIITGFTKKIPEVGSNFVLISNPFNESITNPNAIRIVNTSIVTEVSVEDKTFTFKTESGSIYQVSIISYPKGTQ